MIRTLYTLVFLVIALSGSSQVLSKFTWDSNPITKADTGPDGTTGPATIASSVSGGAGGTNGLTPNGQNINMVLPGSTFTVPGIDISIDFRKKENSASFFTLGSFDFGLATGSIYINYLVKIGGVDVLRQQNTQFTVIDDGNFHTYRFVYNNTTGIATLSVDGTTVQTYTESAGTPLSWTGAGNAIVGSQMDGSGTNQAELDNLIVQLPPVVLAVELLSFDAVAAGDGNELSWTTSQEVSIREFAIQRSVDGLGYTTIGVVYAGDGVYGFTDRSPAASNFYRLKITGTDNSNRYSPVKKLNNASAVSISCYPNPVVNYVNIRIGRPEGGGYSFRISTPDGRILQSGKITGQETSLNVGGMPRGMMIIRVENLQTKSAEAFKIIKE